MVHQRQKAQSFEVVLLVDGEERTLKAVAVSAIAAGFAAKGLVEDQLRSARPLKMLPGISVKSVKAVVLEADAAVESPSVHNMPTTGRLKVWVPGV